MTCEKTLQVVNLEPFDVAVDVAAKLVGLSVSTLNDMATKGDGPAFFYLRGARRYRVVDLKQFVDERPRFRSTTEARVFEQTEERKKGGVI